MDHGSLLSFPIHQHPWTAGSWLLAAVSSDDVPCAPGRLERRPKAAVVIRESFMMVMIEDPFYELLKKREKIYQMLLFRPVLTM